MTSNSSKNNNIHNKKIKVLLVDDNPHDQDLIVDSLEIEHGGFLVDIISSKEELMKLKEAKDYHVLITDFNILGFTGLQVVEEIRKMAPDIPIILVTGTGSEEAAIEALRLGVDDYVIKTTKHIQQLPHRILSVLEKRHLEKEHKQASEAFRQLVLNSPDAILVINSESRIIFLNPTAEKLFGYPKKDLLNKKIYISGLKDGKGYIDFHTKQRHWIGSITSVDIMWFGEKATILNIRDVTERVLAVESLRRAKKELEVRDNISKIFLTCPDEKIFSKMLELVCNETKSSAGVFGIFDDKLRWICDTFWGIDEQKCNREKPIVIPKHKWENSFSGALKNKKITVLESQFNLPEGHIKLSRAVCVPITHGEYLVANLIVANKPKPYTEEEVSLLKTIAKHIAPVLMTRRQRDLEQKRRKEIEEQFFQAQKMESIGRLASGVAHDFNNIIQVILGYGELALNNLHDQEPVYNYVMQMVDAGERASYLIRQLLAFSKKQKMEPKVINLNDLVSNLTKMLKRLIGEHIELQFSLSPKELYIFVDPSQMEQVIMNLVVNSRDAMPNGGTITIKTHEIEIKDPKNHRPVKLNKGKYVVLEVTDTGHGIDSDIIDKIFEPFFTTKKEKGTGLGLSTVYGIIKQSGGEIFLTSKIGKGTTFKIFLPMSDKMAQQDLQTKEKIDIAPKITNKILVVEDEDYLRNFIKEALSQFGYSVETAKTGLEALELILERKIMPCMIICDLVMPKMGGKELMDRLTEKGLNFPFILMSGYPNEMLLDMGIESKKILFLQKPFSISQLLDTISSALNLS